MSKVSVSMQKLLRKYYFLVKEHSITERGHGEQEFVACLIHLDFFLFLVQPQKKPFKLTRTAVLFYG